jgi:hypothetical protein
MTRRLRPRKTRTLSAEDNASNSGDEPVPKPLRKRTKRTKDADGDYDHVYDKALPSEASSSKSSAKGKVKKGRVGKLAQLPKMPLDILFEVCFRPMDHLLCIHSCMISHRYLPYCLRLTFFASHAQANPFGGFSCRVNLGQLGLLRSRPYLQAPPFRTI